MNGDKAFAVIAVAIFMGVFGSMIVGWPAMVCAAISIAAISMSKDSDE